jgi:hypothetical protein
VIGLTIAPDLILWLSVARGKQRNNLVAAEPDPVRRIVFGVADVLADGVAMRSHDRILSGTQGKALVLLIRRQDQPCTTASRTETIDRENIFLLLA